MITCRPAPAGMIAGFDLAAELDALASLDLAQLRARWRALINKPLPKVRQTLLRMALAAELQALCYGGLPLQAWQRLAQLAGTPQRKAPPPRARRLIREWHGTLHTVLVTADGSISWNGQTWNSLSEVARAITGTRWSGPAFFGLKPKRRTAA